MTPKKPQAKPKSQAPSKTAPSGVQAKGSAKAVPATEASFTGRAGEPTASERAPMSDLLVEAPGTMEPKSLFCHRLPDGELADFYGSEGQVRLCCSAGTKVLAAELREAGPTQTPTHWGFIPEGTDELHHVYSDPRVVGVCFGGGMNELALKGRLVSLVVTLPEPA